MNVAIFYSCVGLDLQLCLVEREEIFKGFCSSCQLSDSR